MSHDPVVTFKISFDKLQQKPYVTFKTCFASYVIRAIRPCNNWNNASVMKALHLRPSCVNPLRTLLPPTATHPGAARFSSLFPKKQWRSPTRMHPSPLLKSAAGHLWRDLHSEECRLGEFWETAGFLAIGLAGFVGIAISIF